MKRTTGRGPKDKGREFEKEVRSTILKALPAIHADDIICRAMGDPGVDLILSQAARKYFPFAPELKRSERINIYAAIEQAEAHADKERLNPAVIFRRSRARPWACISLDMLLWMLKIISEYEKNLKMED